MKWQPNGEVDPRKMHDSGQVEAKTGLVGARLAKVAKTTHQSDQARSTGPPWTPVFGPNTVLHKNKGKTSRRMTFPCVFAMVV